MIKARNYKEAREVQPEPEKVKVVETANSNDTETADKEVVPEPVDFTEEINSIDGMTLWRAFSFKYPELANAFETSMIEQLYLIASKMLDYGTSNLKAGTQLKTEEEIKFALEGIWFRLNDKVQHWRNMIFTGQKLNNETLYDTFMDIANYAVIAKLISRGVWDNK